MVGKSNTSPSFMLGKRLCQRKQQPATTDMCNELSQETCKDVTDLSNPVKSNEARFRVAVSDGTPKKCESVSTLQRGEDDSRHRRFQDLTQREPRIKRDTSTPTSTSRAASKATRESVRSIIVCPGICCASEIPMVRTLVENQPGVHQVKINVTLRQVLLDHDPQLQTAAQLTEQLQPLGGCLLRDGAAQQANILAVTSQFLLRNANAVHTVEEIKRSVPGNIQDVVLEGCTVTITYDPRALTAHQIANCLEPCSVQQDGVDQLMERNNSTEKIAKSSAANTSPQPTVVLSGLLWVLSMLSFIGGNWKHVQWVALASVAFGLPPIGVKALGSLKRWHCDTNCLMLFASIGAIALEEFTEAAAVVFLFALSEWLETRATTRAHQALAAIVELQPDTARLLCDDGQLLIAPASVVPVGSLVSVNTGDKVPCDGIVVEGSSAVDESSLTGESRPIRKVVGSQVSGGTVNCGLSPLTVQTTSTSGDSAIARLVLLVEEAQANRSATEACVEQFAAVYTPLVICSALLMCTLPWIWGLEVGRKWTHTGLVIVVVACPCALIISTPVSYVAGLAATAAHGVLIKGGAYLEALAKTKIICFDKTGTLTNGEFVLLELEVVNPSFTRRQVLEYLCIMEEKASHPVAQAILKGARNEKVPCSSGLELREHQLLKGEGIVGIVNGRRVHVGNSRLFQRLGLLKESDSRVGATGYMSIEGYGIVCSFTAADSIRSEAASVVKSLQDMGIQVYMLTGDNAAAAMDVGNKVGLNPENVLSALLPEEKLAYVRNLVAAGGSKRSTWNPMHLFSHSLVMMCGDGVNDSPALAAANVGVAMGEGAALSMETADITLLDSNLAKVEYSIRMGRRVTAKIVQNIVFSVVVKFVVLGFALAGKTHLWAAIGADVGAMLLVTLNAMMLLPEHVNSTVNNKNDSKDIEKGKAPTYPMAREHASRCFHPSGESHCCTTTAHSHHHSGHNRCSPSTKMHGCSGTAPSHHNGNVGCCSARTKANGQSSASKSNLGNAAKYCTEKHCHAHVHVPQTKHVKNCKCCPARKPIFAIPMHSKHDDSSKFCSAIPEKDGCSTTTLSKNDDTSTENLGSSTSYTNEDGGSNWCSAAWDLGFVFT